MNLSHPTAIFWELKFTFISSILYKIFKNISFLQERRRTNRIKFALLCVNHRIMHFRFKDICIISNSILLKYISYELLYIIFNFIIIRNFVGIFVNERCLLFALNGNRCDKTPFLALRLKVIWQNRNRQDISVLSIVHYSGNSKHNSHCFLSCLLHSPAIGNNYCAIFINML